jgi:hypothetical protein
VPPWAFPKARRNEKIPKQLKSKAALGTRLGFSMLIRANFMAPTRLVHGLQPCPGDLNEKSEPTLAEEGKG